MPRFKSLCVVCKVRKQRYADGGCVPCHNRIIAEGTVAQSELKTPARVQRKRLWRNIAKRYNRWAERGLNQSEIAEKLKMSVTQLRTLVYRAKTRYGIKFVDLTRRKASAAFPAPTAQTRSRFNEHGGGRWGISKCPCDLCKQRRRQSKKEDNAEQRRRAKLAKEKLAQAGTAQEENMS